MCRLRAWFLVCSAVILTAACGQGSALNSPTAPSVVPGAMALPAAERTRSAATASVEGASLTLSKGGHPREDDSEENQSENPGRSHQAKVVGFVSGVVGTSLTVNGITIQTDENTLIRHGNRVLQIADIEIGDHVQARGTMEETILLAVEIKVEDTDHVDDGEEEEEEEGEEEEEEETDATQAESGLTTVRGKISGLTGSCPATRTFSIGTASVTTSSSTAYEGVTCEMLANAMKVEVEGTLSGTTVTAASIKKR